MGVPRLANEHNLIPSSSAQLRDIQELFFYVFFFFRLKASASYTTTALLCMDHISLRLFF